MKPQKGYYNEAYDQDNLLDEQPRTVNNDNNNGNDVIVGENVQQQAATEKDPYAGARNYIQELIDASKQRDKDLQRDQRMSRAHEAIAGIADMGRALSNLYFTNQYSPNAFEESGLTDKERARWEKARAEREQNRTNIMNYHMMQGKLDDAERQWKYKQERDKAADEKAAAAAKQAQENFERKQAEVERYHKEQAELKRQANLIADWKARNAPSRRSGGGSGSGGTKHGIIFTDGLGGTITVPKGALLGEVYGCIPEKYRRIQDYKSATPEQMQYDIERYLGDANMNPDIQENIRTLLHLLGGDNYTQTPATQNSNNSSQRNNNKVKVDY